MTTARHQQVSLADTPYYHCISRCVRRAYLCGDDPLTGRNFDHRKRWLVMRVKELAAYFALDVCAYAVMSNHYHLVLRVDADGASKWTDDEVIRRWTALFPANGKMIETLLLNSKTRAARKQMEMKLDLWRERLQDISWFMRCLNEPIARRANREDECTGRFWEGRFKSQALLDEKALVTCMAYVDLNPIRAGITDSLEASDFTSIQERLILHARKVKHRSYRQDRLLARRNAQHLMGHAEVRRSPLKSLNDLQGIGEGLLPIDQHSYFTLLDESSKALTLAREDRQSAIKALQGQARPLVNLGIAAQDWLKGIQQYHRHYGKAAGTVSSLMDYHRRRKKAGAALKHAGKWVRGTSASIALYVN